ALAGRATANPRRPARSSGTATTRSSSTPPPPTKVAPTTAPATNSVQTRNERRRPVAAGSCQGMPATRPALALMASAGLVYSGSCRVSGWDLLERHDETAKQCEEEAEEEQRQTPPLVVAINLVADRVVNLGRRLFGSSEQGGQRKAHPDRGQHGTRADVPHRLPRRGRGEWSASRPPSSWS